jgi:protoheme IX farnesyltransferase
MEMMMINYYLLTKPGILMGNLVTVAAGFILGIRGQFDIWLFLATLIGITLIMASACVFNNYIDRNIDKKMKRTKNRALVTGLINHRNALLFATVMGFLGGVVLLAFTNFLTFIVAGVGFFVYVILYSFWKSKTIYGTAIGSIAGAVPPVIGYCAASNQFDLAAGILFAMMVLWQMPHFFAIALFHLEDYKRAGIPVLPLERGILRTKIHMILYILAFIPVTILLSIFGYTGNIFLIVTVCLGLTWLALAIKGFSIDNNKLWGQQMFRLSLVIITVLCIVMPFDRL